MVALILKINRGVAKDVPKLSPKLQNFFPSMEKNSSRSDPDAETETMRSITATNNTVTFFIKTKPSKIKQLKRNTVTAYLIYN